MLVDPEGHDFEHSRGAWLLKPNTREAAQVAGTWHDRADVESRMGALRASLGIKHLLVTEGEQGMSLFSADRAPLRIAAQRREVYDVSGAGDTVLAALAASLVAGRTLDDAAALANRAAGVVVGKFGTATVQPSALPTSPLPGSRSSVARRGDKGRGVRQASAGQWRCCSPATAPMCHRPRAPAC